MAALDVPLGSQGKESIALSSALLAIATIFCIIRAASAYRTGNRLRWDFTFAIAAVILNCLGFIFQVFSIRGGLGHHMYDLKLDQIEEAIHWAVTSLLFDIAGGTVAKLCVIALLTPVQGVMATGRTKFLWSVGLVQIIVNTILTITIINSCTPISKLWDPVLPGSCRIELIATKMSYFQAGVSALCDFILALWPLSMIRNLRIAYKAKVCFCILMGVGIVPGISCIIRGFKVRWALASSDYTYAYLSILMWGSIEIWLVIILGSIAPIRLIVLDLVKKTTPANPSVSTDDSTDKHLGTPNMSKDPELVGIATEIQATVTHSSAGSHVRTETGSV